MKNGRLILIVLAILLAVGAAIFDHLTGVKYPNISIQIVHKIIYMFFGIVIWKLTIRS